MTEMELNSENFINKIDINNAEIKDNEEIANIDQKGLIDEKINEVEFMPSFKVESDDSDTLDLESAHSNIIILGNKPPLKRKATAIEGKENTKDTNTVNKFEVDDVKLQLDNEYDSYTDNKDRIYKKYRLRENRNKPNYRIPTVKDLPKISSCKREIIKCPYCVEQYTACGDLRKHIRYEHKVTYTCVLCSQNFTTNTELINHKKIHEDENRTYLCNQCKQAFSDHCDYLIHELTHSNVSKLYNCPECSFIYYSKHSYECHIHTHFNKLLECHICSKKLNSEKNLKAHINRHSKEFKCVECEMVFNEKTAYNNHMAIHTGVKLHQCLYCGKAFRLMTQKNVHTRIHTQKRLYSCKKCDRKFLQYTNLERHAVKHNPEKKLTCKMCNKKFQIKMALAAHMRVHSKEYNCPECSRKFPTINGLKAHILHAHTNERTEVCKLCDIKFVTKSHLKRHFQSKTHKNNEYKAMLDKVKC